MSDDQEQAVDSGHWPARPRERFDLCWMITRHLPEVMAIERASFDWPWTLEELERCLRQRNVIGVVALDAGGEVVGYCLYEMHHAHFHVFNIATRPASRRLGVGRALIDRLRAKIANGNRKRIMVEVREGNLPAQQFFRAMGFRATSVLRDFYEDSDEDAYLFSLSRPLEVGSRGLFDVRPAV